MIDALSPLTRLSRFALLGFALAATGCAYYNGLYNTKDLAGRAEHAERDGRPFDAQALWGQVAIKADTVLARHPRSKWAPEARYYKAKGLAGSGNCDLAVPLLRQVVAELRDPARADAAALALSACEARVGNLAASGLAVERLIDDPDPVRRDEARWRTGVAYRLTGRTEDAIRILRTSRHPQARGELAASLAQGGEVLAAVALADSLLQDGDTLAPWGTILNTIGARDAWAASALLDRLLAHRTWNADTSASWLGADADRLVRTDTAAALAHYEAAFALAPERPAGVSARLAGLRKRLAVTEDVTLLDTITAALTDLAPSAGEALFAARALAATAGRVRVRIDSFVPAAPDGDLRGLLLGELVRDSLGAPRLAAVIWQQAVDARPGSPYAPKLLLAIAGSDAHAREGIMSRLRTQYAANPYVTTLFGTGDTGFQVLEDSLYRWSRLQRQLERQQQRVPPRGNRPTTPAPTQSAPLQ